MKEFKLCLTLKITFKKPKDEDALYETTFFKSKPQIITNDTNIIETLGLTTRQLTTRIGKLLSESSGRTIEPVDKHYL